MMKKYVLLMMSAVALCISTKAFAAGRLDGGLMPKVETPSCASVSSPSARTGFALSTGEAVLQFEDSSVKPLSQQTSILTSQRWPDQGRQAGLDPNLVHYTDPIDLKWAALKGRPVLDGFLKPLSNFGKGLFSQKFQVEVNKQVYLTPNRNLAVTYSSSGVTRVYRVGDGKILATIPSNSNVGRHPEGILAVTNQYFVLGQRGGLHDNPLVSLRSLNEPERVLYSYDLGFFPGIHFSRDESVLVLAGLNAVTVYNINMRVEKTIFLPQDGRSSISTTRLVPGDRYLLIGYAVYGAQTSPRSLIATMDLKADLVSPRSLIDGISQVNAFTDIDLSGTVSVIGTAGDNQQKKITGVIIPQPEIRAATSRDN